jgi:hypothetical protein
MIYTSRRQLHQRRGAHSHSGNYSGKSVWTWWVYRHFLQAKLGTN